MSVFTMPVVATWSARRDEKKRRMESVRAWMDGQVLQADRIVDALQLLIQPADRVVVEGDNQKQADFLSRSLAKADPKKLHDLHMIISSISRPETSTSLRWESPRRSISPTRPWGSA
jgi:malonate decarboxylase alpha subunit